MSNQNIRLRLMSNNIWNCSQNKPWWAERGLDCRAEIRAPGLVRVYKETLPDVIGIQEGGPLTLDALMTEIEKLSIPYATLYGKCTSIIYRADKLELVDSEHHIFPEKIDGFDGEFNDSKSKSYCMGVFRSKENGKLFIFATTHLWWKSEDPRSKSYQPHSNKARELQLKLVLDRADKFKSKYNCPAIVVGDLNTVYTSDIVQGAISRGYVHSHDVATEYRDERNGHHYCFPDGYDMYENPRPFEESIDHILISGAPKGFVKRFERYTPEYYMPLSDHFPVFIDVEL